MQTLVLRIPYSGPPRIVEGVGTTHDVNELKHRGWQITGVNWVPSVEAIDYTLQKKRTQEALKVELNFATQCTTETISLPGVRDQVVGYMGVSLPDIKKYHQRGYTLASVELPSENVVVYEFRHD